MRKVFFVTSLRFKETIYNKTMPLQTVRKLNPMHHTEKKYMHNFFRIFKRVLSTTESERRSACSTFLVTEHEVQLEKFSRNLRNEKHDLLDSFSHSIFSKEFYPNVQQEARIAQGHSLFISNLENLWTTRFS